MVQRESWKRLEEQDSEMRPPSPSTGKACCLSLELVSLIAATFLVIPSSPQPYSSFSPAPLRSSTNSHPSVFRIVEELPPGTIVGSVRENPDLLTSFAGENARLQLQYSFRHSGSSYHYFFIDQSTGIIKTSKRIDRDLLCPRQTNCSLSLDVIILPTQHFRIVRVVVNIEDINDNAPSFPRANVSIDINENCNVGTSFSLPSASDVDSGVFGVQSYVAIHSSADAEAKFLLNVVEQDDGTKAVSLVLQNRLDRESCDSYAITIVAVDAGSPSKSASMLVTVAIGDANDNSPNFDQTSYDVTVPERRTPNRNPVIRVHATDSDLDRNGQVRYSFVEYTETDYGKTFSIDPLSGDIFLKTSLDYERQRAYVLAVMASDLGTGSLSSFAKVNIIVVDENDNPPRISVNALSESGIIAIRENSGRGTTVAQLTVEDDDSGQNAEVECSVDEEQWFNLERTQGSEYRMVSVMVFDREEESEYMMTVTCRDNGQHPLTVSKVIEIEILDDNDNAPVLLQGDPIVVEVNENNVAGAEVGRVDARDRDVGLNAQLRFNLTSEEVDSTTTVLSINQITGHLYANVALDFERRSEYTFRLSISDLGDPPQTTLASLFLRVGDTNDEVPRFEKPAYYFITVENQPAGTPVGSARATDGDRSLRFSQILYRLLESSLPFQVDPDTGLLSVARKLDREEIKSFTFVVICQNIEPFSHVRSSVNVTVYVDDENDNAPVIRFPAKGNNVAYMQSSARNGSLVARVDAWDPDDGPNAKLSYAISHGNEDFLFSIDEETGAIVTNNRHLDRDFYNLVIVVRDGGNPSLFSVGDLLVKINGSGSEKGQGHFTFPQQDASRKNLDDKLIIIVGMIVAFFIIMLAIGIALLLSLLWQRRQKREHKKVVSEADPADVSNDAELTAAAADSERLKYPENFTSRFLISHESCSSSGGGGCRGCPFVTKTDAGILLISGNERKRSQDGDSISDKKTPDNNATPHDQQRNDEPLDRLSCDEVLRSRVAAIRRPIRLHHDVRHVVPLSKSCDFIGLTAGRLGQMQERIEMRDLKLNSEVPLGYSYEYSDCSDSCIDSGLDPNDDCDHATYAAMTESCTSYLPAN